jgi:hypothetical protein
MESFVNETANTFANLATATASDRQMLADLTAINKELTKQLAVKDYTEIATFGTAPMIVTMSTTMSVTTIATATDITTITTTTVGCMAMTVPNPTPVRHAASPMMATSARREATHNNTMQGSVANKAKVM